MSKEIFDDLIKKYLDAESTIAEEQRLFNAEDHPPGIAEWSRYIKRKGKDAPANLNDAIRASLQARKRKRHRVLVGLSAVAASVLLFVALFTYKPSAKNISNEQKKALLDEAMSMFPEERRLTEKQNIIYEDEMIVIYTASN